MKANTEKTLVTAKAVTAAMKKAFDAADQAAKAAEVNSTKTAGDATKKPEEKQAAEATQKSAEAAAQQAAQMAAQAKDAEVAAQQEKSNEAQALAAAALSTAAAFPSRRPPALLSVLTPSTASILSSMPTPLPFHGKSATHSRFCSEGSGFPLPHPELHGGAHAESKAGSGPCPAHPEPCSARALP